MKHMPYRTSLCIIWLLLLVACTSNNTMLTETQSLKIDRGRFPVRWIDNAHVLISSHTTGELWNIDKQAIVQTFQTMETSFITAIAMNQHGFFATRNVGSNASVAVWRTGNNQPIHVIQDECVPFNLSINESWVSTTCLTNLQEHQTTLYNLNTTEQMSYPTGVWAMVDPYHQDTLIDYYPETNTIQSIQLLNDDTTWILQLPIANEERLAFHHYTQSALLACTKQSCFLVDPINGTIKQTIPTTKEIIYAALYEDAIVLIEGDRSDISSITYNHMTIHVWKDNQQTQQIDLSLTASYPSISVALSPQGYLAITLHSSDEFNLYSTVFTPIYIYNLKNGNQQIISDSHLTGVTELDWSPSGQHLLSVSNDGTLNIWELK